MNNFYELMSAMQDMSIINTHAHQKNSRFFKTYNLDAILKDSYVNWSKIDFGDSYLTRKHFLERVRYKHYFKSLENAISVLYNLPERLTAENWDTFNEVISKNNEKFTGFEKLKDICHYERVILDTFWDMGSNYDRDDIFAPTFRIDNFLHGYDRDYINHDGIPFSAYCSAEFQSIDEYVDVIYKIIRQKKQMGCVALKSANAYERGLDYFKASKESAQLALSENPKELSIENKLQFESYIFYCLCDIASELDIPFQIHTGLGQLYNTNAMHLYNAIIDHPDTKFVLFHCGYPWIDDVAALYHNLTNVYPDLCWIPLISPTAAENMLNQLLEVGTVEKICWGCDTFTFEESFGALQSVKALLATTLSKKVDSGYYSLSEAACIIKNILYNNSKALYHV